MGRTLIGLGVIVGTAALMAAASGRFTPLHLVAWAIFFASLFWQELFGRRAKRDCRPGWVRRS